MSAFTDKMWNELDKAKRYAAEKLGTVEQLTEFPPEYTELHQRLTHTEAAFTSMQKYGKEFIHAGVYEEVPYADSMKGALSKLNAKLNLSSTSLSPALNVDRNNIHQRFAALLNEASDNLPFGSDLASRLSGLATAERMMSEARAEMDTAVKESYIKLIRQHLGSALTNAKRACEGAEKARFDLDTVKSKCKKAEPADLIKLQEKLQRNQDTYTAAVDDAISLMRLVTESPEIARSVQVMAEAQAKYYKTCYSVLSQCSE